MKLSKLAIREIRVRAVAAPMKRPLKTSIAAVSVAPLLLIDLQTNGGITGRAYLFGITRNALAPIAKLVEAMAEMVKGDAVAQAIQLAIEYDPAPPFAGGHPDRTPQAITEGLKARVYDAAAARMEAALRA